jgi:hypothetical protein
VTPGGTPPGSDHAIDPVLSGGTDGGDGGDRTTDIGEAGDIEDGDRTTDIGEAGDVEDGDEGDGEATGGDPLRFNRWMRSSASGGILTGIALGLQHALEERRELPAFVMEAPGEPEDPDAPISLHFDPDDPTKTVAVIRTPPHDGRRDDPPPPADDA